MNAYDSDILNAVSLSAHRKTDKGGEVQRTFSILLFSVFVVVDLLALMAGASAYGAITKMQNASDARIMSVGPIVSSIRANDATGGITSGEGPEGRSLVLVQRDSEGAYETRIYLYEGKIVQEFVLEGAPYTPDRATELVDSSTFDFTYEDGLLTVTTDAGIAKVALRNLQGGA